jgi:hypothetical protein
MKMHTHRNARGGQVICMDDLHAGDAKYCVSHFAMPVCIPEVLPIHVLLPVPWALPLAKQPHLHPTH